MGFPAFPRVRMVLPTNGERPGYLEECLTSIRRQDEPVDLVIVGPAGAASLLRAAAERHGCRFLVEERQGLSNAINQGWQGATAEYVAWLGDDDLLTQGSLAAALGELDRTPAASMVYGQVRVIDSAGRTLYTMRPGAFASWFFQYGQNWVGQPGCLYRREAVRQVGALDPTLRYAMDFDLHLRLRRSGGMAYLPRQLGCFRVHPTSLTASNPDPQDEGRRVMRRYLGPKARRSEECWWPLARCVSRGWATFTKTGSRR
ncbi:Glycosyltransferase, GT2 family [Streptomyces sp. 2224.1]|nr:Glycosyltransferase, GT2 family [Streptomyces sp. 2112.3]SEE04733.1 Glycosyltransferase, GT2 family [Streptomyces sp. 2224.1]